MKKKKHILEIRGELTNNTKYILALVVAFFSILIWSILSYSNAVSNLILPTPGSVIGAFEYLLVKQELHMHILWSFIRIGLGFLLAIIVSLPLGIMMGTFPFIKHAIQPFTGPLRYLPTAALIPLFMVWFGMDEQMKVIFLFVSIFVYLLPLVIEAVENVDNVFLETAYTLKSSRWQIIKYILWPGAKPLIFEAIRVMNGVGWTYVILAEIINAPYGLGRLITIAQKRSKTDWIFVGIVVILIIGFVSDKLMEKYNAKKFFWRESAASK